MRKVIFLFFVQAFAWSQGKVDFSLFLVAIILLSLKLFIRHEYLHTTALSITNKNLLLIILKMPIYNIINIIN